jgi:benzylsuccinate CoA-transferase BbsF subunit
MTGPLSGLRVLDYCWVGAGALVTKTLADHGAEVIKIESVKRPDNLRLAPPYRKGAEGLEGSGYFASRNSSKKSFALNMSHPEAPAIARRLAGASSVVTSNFRPGIMERWGLAYADVAAFNPSVIYLSMPMQGSDGPHHDFVGFGSTIAALVGLVSSSGRPDRMPVGTGTHYPDHVPNPGHALVAVLAAIYRRQRTGLGQAIELSQFESTVNVMGPSVVARSVDGLHPARDGNRSPSASPCGVFPVAGEDRWCAICVDSDQGFVALADVLRHGEWATDERFATVGARKANEDELERLVAEATRDCHAGELATRLQARGVAAAAVETSGDLLDNPQLVARGYWHRVEHPVMGSIVVNRVPFRSSLDEGAPASAAPLLGQHTRELAASVLGIDGPAYEDLVAREVFV